ncbi:redoxin domain-containing protein [Sphingobacterium athyrii]|nr:redoxin domain-containing protein [Sphingobacterium athyrii]
MINKIKLTAGLLLVTCAALAQKAQLNGNIKGLKDGEIVFYRLVNGAPKMDTVQTKDGQFTWSAELHEPQKISIMFPERYVEFFAEAKNMTLTGTAEELGKLQVKGSPLQDEADAYQKSLQDITDQENPLYQQYGKATAEEKKQIEEKISKFRDIKRERAAEYIKKYPSSFYSLSLVADRAMMGKYEDIQSLYAVLTAPMKNTMQGKALANRLDILKRSAIGTAMLNFSQADLDKKLVSFSSFKGKYVLVDFWASWCGPCRQENPNVLKEYNKYKDKNFTVLGISLDDNEDKWKKAIKDDAMPWTQVSDLKGFNNEVSSYYGIMGIPSTLLVDPNGVIIAKDLRGETLSEKLKELFDN